MISMTTDKQQQPSPRACSLWPALLALTSSLSIAQDSSQQADVVIAPWYQVEVVIFTQQGYTGAEQPPRSYNLEFPEKNLDLREPGQVLNNNFPVAGNGVVSNSASTTAARIIPLMTAADPALGVTAEALSASDLESPEQQSLEQSSPFDDYNLAQLNAQDAAYLASSQANNRTDNQTQTQTVAEVYAAEYEPTFVKLPRDLRNLNESSRALDRQAQYNVVFHEAWRFSADELEQDPWVVIKAGKQYLDRFEIEGSLRFYKSRFLHFQSNLWLLEFDQQGDSDNMIELPEFPLRQQPSLGDSYVIADIQFDEKRIEDFFIDAPENKFAETLAMDGSAMEKVQQPKQYPVKSLWTFDQSKRLEEQQSYYIDHPKMGVLLTIIPHQPEILNPPEETLAEAE